MVNSFPAQQHCCHFRLRNRFRAKLCFDLRTWFHTTLFKVRKWSTPVADAAMASHCGKGGRPVTVCFRLRLQHTHTHISHYTTAMDACWYSVSFYCFTTANLCHEYVCVWLNAVPVGGIRPVAFTKTNLFLRRSFSLVLSGPLQDVMEHGFRGSWFKTIYTLGTGSLVHPHPFVIPTGSS